MKRIPEEYSDILSDFIELLKESFRDNIVSVVLYGSVAKGKARKDSDIDICLIFKNLPRSRYKRILLFSPLLQTLREKESYITLYSEGYLPEITPVLYTVEEIQDTKPIFLDMVEEGVILLDDGTFKKKMQELKRRMKELGTQKVALENGDYYWILKPGLRLGEEVII
jgi:predicted nucleotidyltransferase